MSAIVKLSLSQVIEAIGSLSDDEQKMVLDILKHQQGSDYKLSPIQIQAAQEAYASYKAGEMKSYEWNGSVKELLERARHD